MEEFPYEKYISTAWTTAKNPKPKSTTLAKRALKSKVKDTEESPSRENESKVTLKDLCPEEKAKVGELVKKLALTKSEKDTLEKQRVEEAEEMKAKMQTLEHHNKKLFKTNKKLEAQLEQYMEELSSLHQLKVTQAPVAQLEPSKEPSDRPITPIKSVKEEGTQAEPPSLLSDKEIQASELKSEEKQPKAIHEVQSLRQEIATLSSSLHNFNSSSMSSPFLSSQLARSRLSAAGTEPRSETASEVPKPSFKQLFQPESPEKEERFKTVLERAAASSMRAQKFMREGTPSDVKSTPEKPLIETDSVQVTSVHWEESQPVRQLLTQSGNRSIVTPQTRPEKIMSSKQPVARQTSSIETTVQKPGSAYFVDPPLCEEDLSIMDEVYNESLFDLVEELELRSRPNSIAKVPISNSYQKPGVAESLEDMDLGTELEYSVGSSPWKEKEPSDDSFEELQKRNRLLKSSVHGVIGSRKNTWKP